MIALSASSPFVQGVDTGFDSARLNSVFAFPLSGRAPFCLGWDEFGKYFDKMTSTGVVNSMKAHSSSRWLAMTPRFIARPHQPPCPLRGSSICASVVT